MIVGSEASAVKVDDEVGDIPKELTLQPLPCIAFVGLSLNVRSHVHIWNSFACNRLSDRIPLYYKALSAKNTLIACKPKKSSYEWHIPKGILKSNWLHKHLFEVPSVAVLFVDLEWNESDWEAATTDCAAKVEQLKRQLAGRSTRIALVLIQKNMSLPGDDSLATERAAHLCNICDLSPKSLFVLPLSDPQHFFGYILRMESAFFEMAKSYYQYETKTIKAHKEHLNKTTHQLLFVRHMFKIAFFNEIKQELQNAVKGYKQAYAYLMEVRVSVTNLLEIKTIAGFINYKICKLLFMQSEPMDAFSQFRKHIDIFKSKSEPKELEFEHSAWLSKQFFILGELFEQAIAAGLVPSQTQHPGYYYHEAALQAINRKKSCLKLCKEIVTEDEYSSILNKFLSPEFHGQRLWRPGCQSLEPLDIEMEKEGIRALQFKEAKFVNHSAIIVSMLTNAVTQFKKHKCPRMTRYMMSLIAQEYYSNKDYVNALVFLNQILPFYRLEKWKPILTSLLRMALSASYLCANSIEFVKIGLEYISSWNTSSTDEKIMVQDSICNVMKRELPLRLNIAPSDEVDCALDSWKKELENREQQTLTVNMNSVIPFIAMKPLFASNNVSVDESVKLSIYFKTTCKKPMQFSKLQVIFTHQYYNEFCVNGSTDQLLFNCQEMKRVDFVFDPHPSDAGKAVQIAGVSLHLGEPPLVVVLSWSFGSSEIRDSMKHSWRVLKKKEDPFDQLCAVCSTNVINRNANISFDVEHLSPALVDEDYRCKVVIQNNEEKPMVNVRFVVDRTAGGTSTLISKMHSDGNILSLGQNIRVINCLPIGETTEKVINIRFTTIGVENIRFTVIYDLESNSQTADPTTYKGICSAFKDVELECVYPFTCFFSTVNIRRNALTVIRVEEPFIMRVSLKPLCSHRLYLESMSLQPSYFAALMHSTSTTDASQKLFETVINPDITSEMEYTLYCSHEVLSSQTLGTFIIKWKRDSSDANLNETKILLPEVIVQKSILYVECALPEFGITRKDFQFTCTIYNRTDDTLPLELSMENSDNFMYSGNKQIKFEIGGHKHCKQHYIFYPLVCGYVSLPKLRLVAYPDTSRAMPMDQFLEGLLPTSIQIMDLLYEIERRKLPLLR